MTQTDFKLDVSETPDSVTPVSRKVKLITVHGTGAGDTTATGDRWWQHDSTFIKNFRERLDLDPARVDLSPFQWDDGPNSEAQRRKAAKRLLTDLQGYEEQRIEYYLLGHSHGGSVIYQTLLYSMRGKTPLNHLRQWCTVGTPYLDYRANRFLFQRLKGFGLTVYTTGMVAILVSAIVILSAMFQFGYGSDSNETGEFSIALLLFGCLCILFLRLNERRRNSWFSKSQKKIAANLFSDSWLGLWHIQDEAISALYNIKNVSGPIIPRTFLQPIVAISQVVLIIGFGIIVAYSEFQYGIVMGNLAELSKDAAGFFGAQQSGIFEHFQGTSFGLILLIVVIFFLTLVLKLLAWVFGAFLAPLLNKVIWASVRQRAWGDDLLKEDVHAISPRPPEFPKIFEPVPDRIAEPLQTHSDKSAISTLNKVRLILGMAGDSPKAPDLKTELNESLQWKELIHTSYFDVPEFIDLLALGMHRMGLADLKDGFELKAEERASLHNWLAEHAPQKPEHSPLSPDRE